MKATFAEDSILTDFQTEKVMALTEIDVKIADARTKEERAYLRREKKIISKYIDKKIA